MKNTKRGGLTIFIPTTVLKQMKPADKKALVALLRVLGRIQKPRHAKSLGL